jgi:UDP-N-acetylglucosamine 2-epimerase (non-hydrolysing)
VTVDIGTNTLLGFDLNEIKKYIQQIESGTYKKGRIPELWDGHATERILKILSEKKW